MSNSVSDFQVLMANFYASLSAKQEPLGKDFEKVLYDNLWSLYVDLEDCSSCSMRNHEGEA